MAGLPFPGIEASYDGEAGNVSHAAAPQHHDEEAGGEFAKLRKAVLQHVDPAHHSRHAVYATAQVPPFLCPHEGMADTGSARVFRSHVCIGADQRSLFSFWLQPNAAATQTLCERRLELYRIVFCALVLPGDCTFRALASCRTKA